MKRDRHGVRRRTVLIGGSGIACAFTLPRLLVPSKSAALQAQSRDEPASGASDHALLQAALDQRGIVRLDRTYRIDAPLTIRSDTQLLGNGRARIMWTGPASQPILQDSSVVDPSQANRNIVLQDFEIAGHQGAAGDPGQIAIVFYRTGNVTIRNVVVHGVGGSGIRWGNSHRDTTDILIEQCHIYDCRTGDAIQGSGRRIVIRNNVIGREEGKLPGFGDTGIALLTDFETATNPTRGYSQDVTIIGNTIIGDDGTRRTTGGDDRSQTGIALGPFGVDHVAGVTITDNRIRRCYVNIWIAVTRGIALIGNELGSHGSPLTAGVRLDGVSSLRIERNRISLRGPAGGPDHAAILLNAQRNVFGASTFDADVEDFVITANEITSDGRGEGIRLAFGQDNHNPRYVSQMHDGWIATNRFIGLDKPIVFASYFGENPNVCRNVAIQDNTIDGRASSIAFMAGKPAQYRAITIDNNVAPARIPLRRGTGAMS